MYLPLHNVSKRNYFFKIPVTKLCFFTVSLPLFAFVVCVVITMLKDFENANNTHCKVPNIFPSISASIGNYEPQNTIWKSAIYVHAPLRFFIVHLRSQHYLNIVKDDYFLIVKLATILNVIENVALLGLTHWTSSQYYPYHEVCFKTFIGSSMFYMFFTCMLLTKFRRRPNITNREMFSLKLKWRSFIINVGSFAFAAYFFLRHNKLCEPYVYSMFGFSEYIVVISNVVFHMSTIYDLSVRYIYFTNRGIVLND